MSKPKQYLHKVTVRYTSVREIEVMTEADASAMNASNWLGELGAEREVDFYLEDVLSSELIGEVEPPA